MSRIEFNVKTGETTVIALTQQEISDNIIKSSTENAAKEKYNTNTAADNAIAEMLPEVVELILSVLKKQLSGVDATAVQVMSDKIAAEKAKKK